MEPIISCRVLPKSNTYLVEAFKDGKLVLSRGFAPSSFMGEGSPAAQILQKKLIANNICTEEEVQNFVLAMQAKYRTALNDGTIKAINNIAATDAIKEAPKPTFDAKQALTDSLRIS